MCSCLGSGGEGLITYVLHLVLELRRWLLTTAQNYDKDNSLRNIRQNKESTFFIFFLLFSSYSCFFYLFLLLSRPPTTHYNQYHPSLPSPHLSPTFLPTFLPSPHLPLSPMTHLEGTGTERVASRCRSGHSIAPPCPGSASPRTPRPDPAAASPT